MISVVIAVIVLALVVALVVLVARDPGPPPEDVAVAYEDAWDRLDFEALWTLSGDELHDGLHHREFVAAKRAAYEAQSGLGGLAEDVSVEHVEAGRQVAVVHTCVSLRDGGTAHTSVQLESRGGRWVVVGYDLLRSEPSPPPSSSS
jgi:hypothetical protein